MKTTTILKIVGAVLLTLGLVLILIGFDVFAKSVNSDPYDLNIKPGFIFSGSFSLFLGLIAMTMGLIPHIAKLQSKVAAETMDHAGDDIKKATSKSAQTIIPAVTPAIKESIHEINKNKEAQLAEAKELLDKKLITNAEYDEMRKSILGIK